MKSNILDSYKVALLIGITAGLIFLVYQVRAVVILLFIVLIISSALRPVVEYLEKFNIPRAVSALGILALLVAGLLAVVGSLASSILAEYQSLSNSLVDGIESLGQEYGLEEYLETPEGEAFFAQIRSGITGYLRDGLSQVLSFGRSLFGIFLTAVSAITIIFYLLYDQDKIKRFALTFVPKENREKWRVVLTRIEKKLSYWLQGQLVLMTVVGVISYIGFRVIGVEFALPLAVIVGLTDIIPVIGPIIGFVPVFIVSLVTSPVQAIIVAIFFIVVQQLEGNVLVPRIMSQSVGLDPVAVILALMAGSAIGGITGAILSVPVAAILMILYNEWQHPTVIEHQPTASESSTLNNELSKNMNRKKFGRRK